MYFRSGDHGPRVPVTVAWTAQVSPARSRAVLALRRVADALVSHEVDEAVLDRLADELMQVAQVVRRGGDRIHRIDELKHLAYDCSPAQGETTHHNPDCIVCGPGNPSGLGMRVRRDGAGVVAHMSLDRTVRGAPGRAHGGVMALALDDLMGHVLVLLGQPAYTVRLDTEFISAVPLEREVELRARLVERSGRKLRIEATAHLDETLLVRVDALFITVASLAPDTDGPRRAPATTGDGRTRR